METKKFIEKPTRFGMAVHTFIFNKDFSKILLVKRNEEKVGKHGFAWGIVGGGMELGEYSIDGAMREISEEIGIKLKRPDMRLLLVKELPNYRNVVHSVLFVYAAMLDEKTKITINDESEEYRWFSLDNLPEDRVKEDDIISLAKLAKEKFR
jgi:ADP-ribose pyrophosphatase YjhB (NUDIX family)